MKLDIDFAEGGVPTIVYTNEQGGTTTIRLGSRIEIHETLKPKPPAAERRTLTPEEVRRTGYVIGELLDQYEARRDALLREHRRKQPEAEEPAPPAAEPAPLPHLAHMAYASGLAEPVTPPAEIQAPSETESLRAELVTLRAQRDAWRAVVVTAAERIREQSGLRVEPSLPEGSTPTTIYDMLRLNVRTPHYTIFQLLLHCDALAMLEDGVPKAVESPAVHPDVREGDRWRVVSDATYMFPEKGVEFVVHAVWPDIVEGRVEGATHPSKLDIRRFAPGAGNYELVSRVGEES
jgi:hypothetical protein